jgi:hypothetical protein
MILGAPVSAHLPRFAIRQLVDALQNHRLAVQAPLNRQQLAMVRDPALMPDVTRGIVNAEALAFMTVHGFINLVQDASMEYQFNARARDDDGWTINVEDIPVPDPEIKLPVDPCRTGHRTWGIRGGRKRCAPCSRRMRDQKSRGRPN